MDNFRILAVVVVVVLGYVSYERAVSSITQANVVRMQQLECLCR